MQGESSGAKKERKAAKLKEQKAMSKKAKAHEFVSGESWKMIRQKMVDKIAELNSITDLDDKDCDRINALAIKKAIKIVLAFLYEVEGEARDYQIETEAMKATTRDKIIVNLDGGEDE